MILQFISAQRVFFLCFVSSRRISPSMLGESGSKRILQTGAVLGTMMLQTSLMICMYAHLNHFVKPGHRKLSLIIINTQLVENKADGHFVYKTTKKRHMPFAAKQQNTKRDNRSHRRFKWTRISSQKTSTVALPELAWET